MKRRISRAGLQRGFTLFEVLIALLVVTTGLFGFAKMQALAMASTQVSNSRSVVALQASSLAAAMHGNRSYWASASVPNAFSFAGSTVTDSTNVLSTPVTGSCKSETYPAGPTCTPALLAASDVQAWAANMKTLFPTYSATAACAQSSVTPPSHVSCTLTVNWTEKYVAANHNTVADSDATAGRRSFSLYIEP